MKWTIQLQNLVNHIFFFAAGGRITVQRKHSSVQSTHYNSGFFITTNDFPDFGAGRDGEAIRKRLHVFNTVSLKRKDPTVSGKFHVVHMAIVRLILLKERLFALF